MTANRTHGQPDPDHPHVRRRRRYTSLMVALSVVYTAVAAAALSQAGSVLGPTVVFDPAAGSLPHAAVATGGVALTGLGLILATVHRSPARTWSAGLLLVVAGFAATAAAVVGGLDHPRATAAAGALLLLTVGLPGAAAARWLYPSGGRAATAVLALAVTTAAVLSYLEPSWQHSALAASFATSSLGLWGWFARGEGRRKPLQVALGAVLALLTLAAGGLFVEPGVAELALGATLVPTWWAAVVVARRYRTLDRQVYELHEHSRTLRRVAHTISHDLNQPLVAARTALNTLPLVPADQHDKLLNLVGRAHHDLEERMRELNEYSRMSGRRGIRRAPTDLGALARDVVEVYASRGHGEVVGGAQLHADETLLRRMLTNLVSNAFQHGATAVRVTLHQTEDRVTIRVDDDGPGIPEGSELRLFDPFVRGSDDTAGTGLGLAIVATVAQLHGGEVAVVDGVLGGACFEVALPRVEAGVPPAS